MSDQYQDLFYDIYTKYHGKIHAYCFKNLLRDFNSAQIATNETFLALSRKLYTLKDDEIEKWLYGAAKKCIMDVKRKYAKMHRNTVSLDALEENYTQFAVFESSEPDSITIYKMKMKIKTELSGDEQELFEYRYIQDKPLYEISNILGIPYSTLRYRLEKIKEKSKKILTELMRTTLQ